MRTGEAAVDWGRNQITNPSQDWYRQCLKFVRSCYGIPALYANAGMSWDGALFRHATTDAMSIPRAVPVHWELASEADHIALSLGRGLCLTNDFGAGNNGKIVIARIDDITRVWNGRLNGWTEDLNNVRVYAPTTTIPKADPVDETRLRNVQLYLHIRNQWVNQRIADRAAMSELQKTGSPRFAKAVNVCGDSIDDAMKALLVPTN